MQNKFATVGELWGQVNFCPLQSWNRSETGHCSQFAYYYYQDAKQQRYVRLLKSPGILDFRFAGELEQRKSTLPVWKETCQQSHHDDSRGHSMRWLLESPSSFQQIGLDTGDGHSKALPSLGKVETHIPTTSPWPFSMLSSQGTQSAVRQASLVLSDNSNFLCHSTVWSQVIQFGSVRRRKYPLLSYAVRRLCVWCQRVLHPESTHIQYHLQKNLSSVYFVGIMKKVGRYESVQMTKIRKDH